jgi:hypothetical protein
MHSDDDLSAIDDLLSLEVGRPPATLPLTILMDEFDTWLSNAVGDAWSRNRGYLRAEWESTCGALPEGVRDALGSAVPEFSTRLSAVLSYDNPPLDVHQQASQTVALLQDSLRLPSTRRALWQDTITAATTDSVNLDHARVVVDEFEAVLRSSGLDVRDVVGRVCGILNDDGREIASLEVRLGLREVPERWAAVEPEAGRSASERIRLSGELIGLGPENGDCVIWLAYSAAELSESVAKMGILSFIHSLLVRDGHSPFVSETELFAEEVGRVAADDVVFARVSLSNHPVVSASADAEILSASIINHLMIDSKSGPWTQLGWRVLLKNGRVRTKSSYMTRAELRQIVPTFECTRIARRIDHDAAALSIALGSKLPFNRSLVEVLATLAAAKEGDDRVQILLYDRVVALVAALFGDGNAISLEDKMMHYWPHDYLRQQSRTAANVALRSSSAFDTRDPVRDKLVAKIYSEDALTWSYRVSIPALVDAGGAVVEAASGSIERRSAIAVVKWWSDGEAYADRIAMLEQDARLHMKRRRRVRNALAHGNPATSEVISRVVPVAAYLARQAVDLALRSVADEVSLRETLDKVSAKQKAFLQAVRAGARPADLLMERP